MRARSSSPTTARRSSSFRRPAERRVWLRVGTLLDGASTKPLRNTNVVYDKTLILFVSSEKTPPADLLSPGQRQPDADLPDYTLLPGLIEAHAHLFLEGGELNAEKRAAYLKQTPEELLKAALPRLEKLVRLGIIGVGLALSRLYMGPNRPMMPYLDSPGAAIHHKGRYGSFMAGPIESHPSLRACVESRVKAGADRIYTLNERHFRALAPELGARLVSIPED